MAQEEKVSARAALGRRDTGRVIEGQASVHMAMCLGQANHYPEVDNSLQMSPRVVCRIFWKGLTRMGHRFGRGCQVLLPVHGRALMVMVAAC